jgi:hypothetical protein
MLGGRMVWVGMSRGRFVGGRNIKALLKAQAVGIGDLKSLIMRSIDGPEKLI